MTSYSDHKDRVQREFTRQAAAYAATPSVADPDRVARLIAAVDPSPEARVLDIATGPGYVALGFAAQCREVVGIDLTAAPLAIAEQNRQALRLDNVTFQLGDAEHLPFADGEFDAVVCRYAFHHCEDPSRILVEMARVCRPDGRVAVEDLVVSEEPERAAYQNRFENLRDPSHVRAYPLSELLQLFAAIALEIENVTMDRLVPDVQRWLSNAGTPVDRRSAARVQIERDAVEDLSGARPFWRDQLLYFVQRTAAVVGITRRSKAPGGRQQE